MKILTGLFDHMVVQRNAKNVSQALFSGGCSSAGPVFARVSSKGRVLAGFQKRKVGAAKGRKFSGRLDGVPVGGPYKIELSVGGENAVVEDVCVGDVWILAGQSNMQGVGWLSGAETPHSLVRAFYMTDEWRVAKDPIHNLWEAIDPVHNSATRVKSKFVGVGPGVSFGREMQRLTGVPQGLLSCAHGGTSMSQWDPKLKKLRGGSLYGATIRRFEKNGSAVSGIVWYQGESDAGAPAHLHFTDRMKALVRSFRRDLKSPRLPFVMVQISRVVNAANTARSGQTWNSVQEQQRRLGDIIERCGVVPAIDLPLDDLIHISSDGQRRLGRRLAHAMYHYVPQTMRKLPPPVKPPIEIDSIKIERHSFIPGQAVIVVKYRNVEGKLVAPGEPAGFLLRDGNTDGYIFRTELKGNTARLWTTLSLNDAASKLLHYGAGFQPYCNVTDEKDRSLPVFGPYAFGKPRALTAFIQQAEVSPLLPSAGKLHKLSYPNGSVSFEPRKFDGMFCDRHLELGAKAPTDHLVFYRMRLRCGEPMKLALNFGYDGPVKVWIDGKERFFDPNGINPAVPDAKRIRYEGGKGDHEVLIALGSNDGKAWGVFARIERFDVKKKDLIRGPQHYALPEVVVGE